MSVLLRVSLPLKLCSEQEEVIDRLRKQHEESNTIYCTGLQVVIGLSLVMYAQYSLLA